MSYNLSCFPNFSCAPDFTAETVAKGFLSDAQELTDLYNAYAKQKGLNVSFEAHPDANTVTLAVVDVAALREKWITEQLCDATQSGICSVVDVDRKARVVDLKVQTGEKNRPYFISRAVCSCHDKFDLNVGIAVAWAHAKDEEIPSYI